MLVYAVFTNELDERYGMMITALHGLYSTLEKALEIIAELPLEAAPYWVTYTIE